MIVIFVFNAICYSKESATNKWSVYQIKKKKKTMEKNKN